MKDDKILEKINRNAGDNVRNALFWIALMSLIAMIVVFVWVSL